MPSGVYKRTEKHRTRIKEAMNQPDVKAKHKERQNHPDVKARKSAV